MGAPTNSLLAGVHHVGVLTDDTDALHDFYREVFGATVPHDEWVAPDLRMSFVELTPQCLLNVFEQRDRSGPPPGIPMFERGRLDHVALRAASLEAFDELRDRLMAHGATDGFVTDFGECLSVWFCGPDGTEGEVCVDNPDAVPGVVNPPGTPSTRYA